MKYLGCNCNEPIILVFEFLRTSIVVEELRRSFWRVGDFAGELRWSCCVMATSPKDFDRASGEKTTSLES
jgi:hypothetical protein